MVKLELPDISEMFSLVDEILALSLERSMLDLQIKKSIAEITELVTKDSAYFISGKPPSISYISTTYSVVGLSGELIDKRKRVVELDAIIDSKKAKYDLLKTIIDIWRTQSANERIPA